MKKRIYWFIPVLIVVFACNLPTATVAPGSIMPPEASATHTPKKPAATEASTIAAVATPNVSCNEITLTLDPSLASGFRMQDHSRGGLARRSGLFGQSAIYRSDLEGLCSF